MEEVWKDISLSLSSIYTHRSSSAASAGGGTIHQQNSLNFQDFLDLRPLSNNNKNNSQQLLSRLRDDEVLFTGEAPATVLSLGNGGVAPAKKKRGLLVVDGCNEEERSKRLMKNRESADRSRARKQAYTMELEKEVARLKKENALLKGQLKMFTSEGYAVLPKNHSLQRTLTSPF